MGIKHKEKQTGFACYNNERKVFNSEFFLSWFNGDLPEAIPTCRPGFWRKTIEVWEKEGHLALGQNPCEVVGLEAQLRIGKTGPLSLGMEPAFDVEIIEEDGHYITFRDNTGIVQKSFLDDFKKTKGYFENAGMVSSMSHWLKHPVNNVHSWKEIYEHRFSPDMEKRLSPKWLEDFNRYSNNPLQFLDKYSISHSPFLGTYGMLRHLIGAEPLMYMFYDNPKLIRTILSDMLNFWITLCESFFSKYGRVIGRVHFFEDMCYKVGPLVSPDIFKEFFSPVYTEIIDFFKQNGVSVFSVDSDGNTMEILPELLKCGVNMFLPLEVQSGMDAGQCREVFPELFLFGGIDKRVLSQGKYEIDNELERRFITAYEKGRYWPMLDHGITPISWENWIYFVKQYKKYCSQFISEKQ